jgi:hypothetical protein
MWSWQEVFPDDPGRWELRFNRLTAPELKRRRPAWQVGVLVVEAAAPVGVAVAGCAGDGDAQEKPADAAEHPGGGEFSHRAAPERGGWCRC